MDIKRSFIFGLCTLLSIISTQSQAACCCRRPICYFPPVSNMQGYVDASYGKSMSAHLPSSSYALGPENEGFKFSISPQEKFSKNNFFVETGLLWSQPFLKNSLYLPFLNLGIRYQMNNLNDNSTSMRLDFFIPENGGIFLRSVTPYRFSQRSLLTTFKLDLYRGDRWMPYVNGGLGTTWQHADQKDAFNIVTPDEKPILKYLTNDRENKDFTYTLGAGLDFLITENFWLSLGYQYNNYGDISIKSNLLGSNPEAIDKLMELKEKLLEFDPTINTFFKSFKLNNLSTHTIQLTGRYLFG